MDNFKCTYGEIDVNTVILFNGALLIIAFCIVYRLLCALAILFDSLTVLV